MNADYLTKGIYYFNKHQYDEAIIQFSSLLANNTKTKTELSIINIWLGRCYLNKTVINTTYYTAFAKKRTYNLTQKKVTHTSRIMTNPALAYFEKALKLNPSSISARIWKGRALEDSGKFEQAYACFAEAARLSGNQRIREKCCSLFSSYPYLRFKKTHSFKKLNFADCLVKFSSEHPYIRMEACQYLKKYKLSLSLQEKKQAKEIILSLSGIRFTCFILPFTGDPDSRVQQIAQKIIASWEI
ncbi:tetratricopeptide repeat protein [Candidatus Protochlamydia sp. W-9]|uniref:tetratricopeptide repeat protein n=1 Tax=Candidatus Protochlamydia sp. W-9 TaxID=1785087 RepID=UPI00096AA8F4|nr:tetratricopeptide repeat protein [Candidatus Protochlamydia sp. W-9]